MPISKIHTGIFLILCVMTLLCTVFLGKVQSNTIVFNSSEDLNNTNFYTIFQLRNGDKLAVGNAPYDANMLSVRFDSKGNVLWKRYFGVHESNSILTNANITENADGSITIKGSFSNTPGDIDNAVCVELTLSSDGKLLRTHIISDNSPYLK